MEIPDPFAFDTYLVSTRDRCRYLIYDIFNRSVQLYDADQQGIDHENARVSYEVDGIDTDSGRPALRVREVLYAPAQHGTTITSGGSGEFEPRTEQLYGEPRAYLLECAYKPECYAAEEEEEEERELSWESFGCIVIYRENNRNTVDVIDPKTGRELNDIDIEAVYAVLKVMDDALREELVQGLALTDPTAYQATAEIDEASRLANMSIFEPSQHIYGVACQMCEESGKYCPHIKSNLS